MKYLSILFIFLLIFAFVSVADAQITKTYSNVTVSGGYDASNFVDVWDLWNGGDMTISFTVDLNGMQDDANAHAWAQFGIRELCADNFNPGGLNVGGKGVWFSADYDWNANTFDPDPPGAPILDLDDKLMLQRTGGKGEADYNLPSVPTLAGDNHRFWFDRDGVDQWQAAAPLAVNGGTFNTGGTYDIVITLHAVNATNGTAYMTVNGLYQGFETDGNWNTMELTPAGMTFTGDMSKMQVFYGLYGYGAIHSTSFSDISVTGYAGTAGISVDAGEDVTVYYGYEPLSSIQLNAIGTGSSSFTYSWSPATGLSASNIQNPVASPTVTTTYTVTATSCGLSVTDEITVNVEDVTCGNNSDKISIYHLKGNGDYVRLCVSPASIESHLAHGDVFGLGKDGRLITEAPAEFKLNANFPNPFNPSTRISFQVPELSKVQIVVFNSIGEQVTELVNEVRNTGYYEVEWNASSLPSGIYFYRMTAGDFTSIQKMILMK